MIKNVNYGFLIEFSAALSRMATLTGKIGYAIMRTHNNILPELDIIEKMRVNLIQKYGKDGKITPESENWDAYLEEYLSFVNDTKVDVEIYQVEPEEWDDDKVFCEMAQASDYTFIKNLLVKSKEGSIEGNSEV